MQVISAIRPCFLTGSSQAIQVGTRDRRGKRLRTVISIESGLVYTDPPPSDEQLRRFYSEEYRVQYKGTRTPSRKHLLRGARLAKMRLNLVKSLLPQSGSLLDIGCGGGELVFLANAAGFKAVGIEPNRAYVEFAQKEFRAPVEHGFLQDCVFGSAQFECVTLFHVLEHLENPLLSLKKIREAIPVGGHLVVEVPDVEYCGIAPHHRWHVGHLFNFNVKTLVATGLKAGFELTSITQDKSSGVLLAVFRKPLMPVEPELACLLNRSFTETYSILRSHHCLAHYLGSTAPFTRFCRKAWQYVSEYRELLQSPRQTPKSILARHCQF